MTWSIRRRFADLKIRTRIAVIIAPLMLGLLTASALATLEKRREWINMDNLARLADLMNDISALVHELQKERGMTGVFITSKGAQFASELQTQRQATSARRAAFEKAAVEIEPGRFGTSLSVAVARVRTEVSKLDAMRQQISAFAVSGTEGTGFYTSTIRALLELVPDMMSGVNHADAAKMMTAYFNLMQGKERAGQERALGAQGFSSGKFTPEQYRRFSMLGIEQDGFFRTFELYAPERHAKAFRDTVAGPPVAEVARMRKLAVDGGERGELGGVTGPQWFAATTQRIDLMKTVEDKIADELGDFAQAVSASARREFMSGLVAGGGMLVLSAFLAFLVSRQIVASLTGMGEAMQRLAKGDTSTAIPALGQRDEIGAMAGSVQVFKDNMIEAERLRAERVEAEKRAADEKRAAMHKLAGDFESTVGGIIGTVTSASAELEAAANTLTRTAETGQQLAGTVAAASEEASSNVQSVASAAEEMAGSVNEIGRQVQESSKIATEAVAQAEKTDGRINELSQAASRIGDVVKLITAIAEQTNLLALNATIEAARAGEAGRGFAVVAQEVKALAAQTAKATDEISGQITGMQSATQEAVVAIKEIGGTINRISEIAATIAAAVEEQGAATQEIARNVQQAAQGTTQVAQTISDVNKGAAETGAASAQVLSSAQSLSGESSRLKLEVDRFLSTVRAA